MPSLHQAGELSFTSVKVLQRAKETSWLDWLTREASSLGGALWSLADRPTAGRPGAGHSHVLHLPTFEARSVLSRAAGDERRHDRDGAGHTEVRQDEWIRAAKPIVLSRVAEPSALIVAEVVCADPLREAEWDAWYDEQHLPDMMDSGAFVAGSRWTRRERREGNANHLTVYEISGRSLDEAIECSAAVMPGLIAAGRKHASHAGGLTWALDRCV